MFLKIPMIPKFLWADINTTAKILENTNDYSNFPLTAFELIILAYWDIIAKVLKLADRYRN